MKGRRQQEPARVDETAGGQEKGVQRIRADKPRDLPPLDLLNKGDTKTIVDWMNGHAKMKTRIGTVEKALKLLRDWRGRGMRLRQRTTDWVTHTFREHHKEADLWAGKGAKGRAEEWVDTRIAWQEVTGVCGFWDGSNDNGKCGGGIVLMAFSEPHGWFTFYKQCGPAPGNSSLDAEMGGCGMLIDNVHQWMEKCARKKRAVVRTIEIEVVSFTRQASHAGRP